MTTSAPPGRAARRNPTRSWAMASARITRWSRRRLPVAALMMIVVLATLQTRTTQATFVGTTINSANTLRSGTVTFGANTPAGTTVTVTGVVPGSFGTACVRVNYTGSLPATVRLYVPAGTFVDTGLGPYLAVQVRSVSGTAASCVNLSTIDYNAVGLTDFTKTVVALRSASYDYATGIGTWSATSGASRTYQLSWLVAPNNAGIGKKVTFDLVWEARS